MPSRRNLSLIFVFAALTAMGVWFLLKKPEPADIQHILAVRSAGAIRTGKRAATATPSLPVKSAEPPVFGSEKFKMRLLERGAVWLTGRNRDAAGLLAMWDISGEEALLREAAEKFPNNPQVCLAMLNFLSPLSSEGQEKQTEAKTWVESLIAATPGNTVGQIWNAAISAEAGDSRNALISLKSAALPDEKENRFLSERILQVQGVAKAAGLSEKEAALLSTKAPAMRNVRFLESPDVALIRFFRASLQDTGNFETNEMAELGINIARRLLMANCPDLRQQSAAMALTSLCLEKLAPDSKETDAMGKLDRGNMIPDEQEIKEVMQKFEDIIRFVNAAPDEIAVTFAGCYANGGEFSAMRWALLKMQEQQSDSVKK